MIKLKIAFFCILGGWHASVCFASPSNKFQKVSDQNMKIAFEVHAPWNILDGSAQQLSGDVTVAGDDTSDRLRANVSAQNIDYKAGLSLAGRLVAAWLRSNPPTPAKFVISKSSINCSPDTQTHQPVCKGSVDGTLTIWGKEYKIDFPVETDIIDQGVALSGGREIKWGEYGFGDPDSTIASLEPVIAMNFSVLLSKSSS